jgi:two-component system chemotaxis response regulator CheY
MKRVLESMGITRIATAQDGQEGLQRFGEQHFDVIITDLNMPVMDGREMAERIRTDLGNTFVPIIVTTSEQDGARLASVEQAGVSAICDKPFEPGTIREILIRAMSA